MWKCNECELLKSGVNSLILMPCLNMIVNHLSNSSFSFFLGAIEASFDVHFVGERLQD